MEICQAVLKYVAYKCARALLERCRFGLVEPLHLVLRLVQ